MQLRYRIKRRRGRQILDLWGPSLGSFDEFLKYEADLLSRISGDGQFFLDFPSPSSPLRTIVGGWENDELCTLSYDSGDLIVIQPVSTASAVEVLRRLRAASYNGASAYAPAAAGYIPRPTTLTTLLGLSWGVHWFKAHLPYLKWYCLLYLEYPRMELWSKRGVDKACDDFFERLQAEGVSRLMVQ